jgi:hypothetical protein
LGRKSALLIQPTQYAVPAVKVCVDAQLSVFVVLASAVTSVSSLPVAISVPGTPALSEYRTGFSFAPLVTVVSRSMSIVVKVALPTGDATILTKERKSTPAL